MTDDEVEAWLARTRTTDRDHRLPHDADRASLRTRLRGELDALGVESGERDAVVEACAAEMARLFSAHATTAPGDRADDAEVAPAPVEAPAPVHTATPDPRSARVPSATVPATTPVPVHADAPASTGGTATMPAAAPEASAPPPPRATATLPPGWFRSRWRRLHWTGRAALVLLGPPATLVLGLMALCTVSPPAGAALLGTTNRVFDGEIYGHDFVGFGKGRYETTPWQFTFLHPSRAAMDRLRVQCEDDPGFAPPVCATVEHSYRIEQHGGRFTKVVDADNERTWFEREACPALAQLDQRIYSKNPDAGWERYRSHGCVPYDV